MDPSNSTIHPSLTLIPRYPFSYIARSRSFRSSRDTGIVIRSAGRKHMPTVRKSHEALGRKTVGMMSKRRLLPWLFALRDFVKYTRLQRNSLSRNEPIPLFVEPYDAFYIGTSDAYLLAVTSSIGKKQRQSRNWESNSTLTGSIRGATTVGRSARRKGRRARARRSSTLRLTNQKELSR
jgi:hypothetical protein